MTIVPASALTNAELESLGHNLAAEVREDRRTCRCHGRSEPDSIQLPLDEDLASVLGSEWPAW